MISKIVMKDQNTVKVAATAKEVRKKIRDTKDGFIEFATDENTEDTIINIENIIYVMDLN